MQFSITLVDINPRLVAAWQIAFADAPEVSVAHGSLLKQRADVWVTPTNARARMDGGVDAVLTTYLGKALQARVQREVAQQFGGRMPVGCAVCTPTLGLHAPVTGHQPKYVISTPTMDGSSEDVSRTDNAAWAFAGSLQAAAVRDELAREAGDWDDGGIRAVAVPGLGTSTGRLGARDCAEQMRLAYDLFRRLDHPFESFDALHATLLLHLGAPPALKAASRFRATCPPKVKRKRRLFGIFAGN